MVMISLTTKLCACKTHSGANPLPIELFGRNARKADGYDYYCKACRSAYHKKLYVDSADKVKQRVSEWQTANKNRVNANSKNYRELNTESRRLSTKKWRDAHGELMCFLANKRRATKLNATPDWFEEDAIRELYASCPKGSQVHHIVPLQEDENVCGLHCLANLIVLTNEAHVKIHSDLETLRGTYSLPNISIIT